jgi:hypothetical protein
MLTTATITLSVTDGRMSAERLCSDSDKEENQSNRRKECPYTTSSNTNRTGTGKQVNQGLRCERPATDRPSHTETWY